MDVYAPDLAATPRGCVAFVHGGYWREPYTLDLMLPLVERYCALGWTVANIEYRRGAGQPWPAARDDVREALRAVRADSECADLWLVSMGHSVGGQLVLLGADQVDAVVALAPVTDASRTFAERLGSDAALDYFRVAPHAAEDLYTSASPVRCPKPKVPTLVVHGADDDRVPIAHTLDYVDVAWSEGVAVDLDARFQLGHMELIEPGAVHWASVDAWLASK